MSAAKQIEWLSLVEVTGPFLAVEVLDKAMPTGLDSLSSYNRKRIRSAYEEWNDAVDQDDPRVEEFHREWIRLVLEELLEYDSSVMKGGDDVPESISYQHPQTADSIRPDYAVLDDGKPKLLVATFPPGTDLESPLEGEPWAASPLERMTLMCRSIEAPIGLVTNGERWTLVGVPSDGATSYGSWFSRIWLQEPITLQAFQTLLGVRRCFGSTDETLEALLSESLENQAEVIDALGNQVRRAVEVLIQALARADRDREGDLLKDVEPQELYEAGLTVMMRLVFILCAEERELLLLGDPVYDQNYAISNLRAELREEAEQHGPEILERRFDAWLRTLSCFRMIYRGVEHPSLRMPALGGSLFDPDRFPFLEGRGEESDWKQHPAVPLPIDNRTVMLLLRALQVLEQPSGARLLSYRGLDVEQIGHVYEGLLEFTVARTGGVAVALVGPKKVSSPILSLSELEEWDGASLAKKLASLTGRSLSAIKTALGRETEESDRAELVLCCEGDEEAASKLLPVFHLIRRDSWGALMTYPAGSFAVVPGPGRRATGAHYTPKSFAEAIVERTLEPIVYAGPSEGLPREDWSLRSPEELLNLKVCDPAMGSGAFLVQTCRYLAERLVEAWAEAEEKGEQVGSDGLLSEEDSETEPLPTELDERLFIARRMVAERCLYGVDMNPMAVELAKLSIWLVTLQKGRPFGFLDHNLRSGDSLLGIQRMEQLTTLSMNPSERDHPRIFGREIEQAADEALELRRSLREIPIRDIRDIEAMARLDEEAKALLSPVEQIADAMVGEALRSNGKVSALTLALDKLATKAGDVLRRDDSATVEVKANANESLSVGRDAGEGPRAPFHWAIEYPEVFARGGFDAFVGNPPYGGKNTISDAQGAEYLKYLTKILHVGAHGNSDLVAHFFRSAFCLLREAGCSGLIATKTISQGDTRQSGLAWIRNNGGTIYEARKRVQWPGAAAVVVSVVYLVRIARSEYKGNLNLDGKEVSDITAFLFDSGSDDNPWPLRSNGTSSYIGNYINGTGFTFDDSKSDATPVAEMRRILKSHPSYSGLIHPYIGGEEILNHPEHLHHRYVINFGDMTLEEARLFPELFSIVEEKVKKHRVSQSDKAAKARWWQWARKCKPLHAAKENLTQILVHPNLSSYLAFTFLPKEVVVGAPHNVLIFDTYNAFAILQSHVHELWARFFSSTLKDDLRYTPSDCFETFPFPENWKGCHELSSIGKEYYEFRAQLLRETGEGLTKAYTKLHHPDETDAAIEELRRLQAKMDKGVLDAYQWSDIPVERVFEPAFEVEEGKKIPWRYRWPQEVHDEVLNRLLVLNQELHRKEDELAAFNGESNSTRAGASKKSDSDQKELF